MRAILPILEVIYYWHISIEAGKGRDKVDFLEHPWKDMYLVCSNVFVWITANLLFHFFYLIHKFNE